MIKSPTFMPTKSSTQMHRFWWTALPAVPSTRESSAYRRLKRQFADHTMNTWAETAEGIRPGGRGFYVEGREDHLVPAFFEDFSLFPDSGWFEELLALGGVRSQGRVSRLNWSYSFEGRVLGEARPRIADVVFMWEDEGGYGIFVVEAKKATGKPSIKEKDQPAAGYYLQYPHFRAVGRCYQALLVSSATAERELAGVAGVLTWDAISALKMKSARALSNLPDEASASLEARLRKHHANLGLTRAPFDEEPNLLPSGWHEELARQGVRREIRDWLLGSETYFAAREGILPAPHLDWLTEEQEAGWWRSRRLQSTTERELVLWRLT